MTIFIIEQDLNTPTLTKILMFESNTMELIKISKTQINGTEVGIKKAKA